MDKKSGVSWIIPLTLVAFLAGSMLLGLPIFASVATSQTYNNVQVFITPQNATDNSFLISAYNSTGGLVATSQSEYPAFSLELPSGTWLLTVVASQPYSYGYPSPLVSSESSSAIVYPISSSPAEYGYSMVQISSSRTIDISTTPISDLKTAQITVNADYLNGSAVSGASVGASIVGGWYWIYEKNVVLSNQTNTNGIATLTVPSVPIEVTAWKWVPVNLPKNETTTRVNVGGGMVNVTVYWQPSYVGLAGEALVIPPQTKTDLTLSTQQSNFWVMPYGVATPQTSLGISSASQVVNSQGGVPANQYSQVSNLPGEYAVATQTISNEIPPLPVSSATTTVTTVNSTTIRMDPVLEIGLVISVIAAASALILVAKKK